LFNTRDNLIHQWRKEWRTHDEKRAHKMDFVDCKNCGALRRSVCRIRPASARERRRKQVRVRSGAFAGAEGSPSLRARCAGTVSIAPGGPVEVMNVRVTGLPPNTDFDFFVIQQPNGPFGMSWYQGDIETNSSGIGRAKFYWPLQYRNVRGGAWLGPGSPDLQQCVS
jgi:hypothetical protein